jgi:hypothetical protein
MENLIKNEGLLVVGAEYAPDTGKVDFSMACPSCRPD